MVKVILTPFSGTPKETHEKAYLILQGFLKDTQSRILKTDKGKPYLENGEFYFSVSHTKELIAIAVSDKDVGIDCEKSDRVISQKVGNRFLGKNTEISSWVHFEAFAKLHGDGIPVGYDTMLKTPHIASFLEAYGHIICVCAFEHFEIQML